MTYGENTRAAHTPAPPVPEQTPLGLPVYRTAAWSFDSAKEYADVLGGAEPGYSYSRVDNPTADAFAAGMAAISTVLMTLTSAGAHVVAPREVYGGTYGLLTTVLNRFGVTATF